MKMRRPTRSAGGHRREGKATCHGCERPTQTKRRRRPAAETAQCINRMARRALLPARPGTCPTGKNAQAICKYASNARLDFSYRMHCRRNCSSRARTLHHPAPTIPPQRPTVLRAILRPATAPVRRNQLHPSRRKRPVQRIALPGLVAHQPLRNLPCQHEIEPPLCQSRLMRPGRTALHRNRQSPGVHGNEDLHPLAHLRAPDPVASTTCRTERRIRKAFVQPILSALLHQLPGLLQQPFEYTLPHQPLEEPVHGAFGAELSRQILPLGSVVQQPEDARQCLVLVGSGAAALGVPASIGNTCAEPIQQSICTVQHDCKTTNSRTPVNGFGMGSKWHVVVRLREPIPGVRAVGVERHVGLG